MAAVLSEATFIQKHFNQPSSTDGRQHTPAQTLHTHTGIFYLPRLTQYVSFLRNVHTRTNSLGVQTQAETVTQILLNIAL